MPWVQRQPEPPIYTFRVRILGGVSAPADASAVWRELEVAANQTLADLGEAVPRAFGFTEPHLWSFFLSGRAWDAATEYVLHGRSDAMSAHRSSGRRDVLIHSVEQVRS